MLGVCGVVQALSGTGSLRLGAAIIARFMKGTTVYISNPTWGNHRNIFGDEGVEWKYYRSGHSRADCLRIGTHVTDNQDYRVCDVQQASCQ